MITPNMGHAAFNDVFNCTDLGCVCFAGALGDHSLLPSDHRAQCHHTRTCIWQVFNLGDAWLCMEILQAVFIGFKVLNTSVNFPILSTVVGFLVSVPV